MRRRLAAWAVLTASIMVCSSTWAGPAEDALNVAFQSSDEIVQSTYIVFDQNVAVGQVSNDAIARWIAKSLNPVGTTPGFQPGALQQTWVFTLQGRAVAFGIVPHHNRRLRCGVEVGLLRGSHLPQGSPNNVVVAQLAVRNCRYSNLQTGEAFNIQMSAADVKTVLSVITNRASTNYGGSSEYALPDGFRVSRPLLQEHGRS